MSWWAERLESAIGKWRQGDLEGAAAALREAVVSGDDAIVPEASHALGDLLREQGDLEGARAAHRSVIASGHPVFAQRSAMSLGLMLADEGQTALACRPLRVASEGADAEIAAMADITLVEVLRSMGDYVGAAAALERARQSENPLVTRLAGEVEVPRRPDDGGERERQAWDAYEAVTSVLDERGGEADEIVVTGLNRMLSHGMPDLCSKAAFRLYQIYAEQGHFDECRRVMEHAIAVGDPAERGLAEKLLGAALFDLDEHVEARDAYRRAAEDHRPEVRLDALIQVSKFARQLGDEEEARAILRRVVESGHPKFAPEARACLGQVHSEAGEVDEAVECWRIVLESDSEFHAGAVTFLGTLLHGLDADDPRHAEIVALLRTATALDDPDVSFQARMTLAQAAGAARGSDEELEQAVDDCDAALERVRAGDVLRARALLRRVVDAEIAGQSARAAVMLALVELGEGDADQAEELLIEVAEGDGFADGFGAALFLHLLGASSAQSADPASPSGLVPSSEALHQPGLDHPSGSADPFGLARSSGPLHPPGPGQALDPAESSGPLGSGQAPDPYHPSGPPGPGKAPGPHHPSGPLGPGKAPDPAHPSGSAQTSGFLHPARPSGSGEPSGAPQPPSQAQMSDPLHSSGLVESDGPARPFELPHPPLRPSGAGPVHPVLAAQIAYQRLGREAGIAHYQECAEHPDPAVAALAKSVLAQVYVSLGVPRSQGVELLDEAAESGDPLALSHAAVLSWILRGDDEPGAVIELLRRAREHGHPRLAPWTAFALGSALEDEGASAEALAAYDGVRDHPGLRLDAEARMLAILEEREDLEGASALLERVADRGDPLQGPRSVWLLGLTRVRMDALEAARTAFARVPLDHPELAEDGVFARRLLDRDFTGARAALTAIRERGDDARAQMPTWLLLETAHAWQRAGETSSTDAALRLAITVGHPGRAQEAAIYLGALRNDAGDKEGAAEAWGYAASGENERRARIGAKGLGQMRFELGDTVGAAAAYRQALEATDADDEEYAGLLDSVIHALVASDRVDEARAFQAEKSGGDGPHAALAVGDALQALGRLDEAAELYREAAGGEGEAAASARVVLAMLLAGRGQAAEAVELARSASGYFEDLGEDGEETVAYIALLLGGYLSESGDDEGARESYERAARAADPEVRLPARECLGTATPAERATLRLMEDDRDAAVELLTEAYGTPLLAELHLALAEERHGDLRTVLERVAGTEHVERAASLVLDAASGSEDARELFGLVMDFGTPEQIALAADEAGRDLDRSGDPAAAIEVLTRGSEVDHPAALACLRRLLGLLAPGDDREATEAAARKAVASGDPETVTTGVWTLGDLAKGRGDLAAAADAYRTAIETAEPDAVPYVRIELGQVLHALGETGDAHREMEAVLESGDHGAILLAGNFLGAWLAQDGRLAGGAEAFGAAAAAGEGHPSPGDGDIENHRMALNNLAAVAHQADEGGDPGVAVRALRLAAEGGAHSDAVAIAKEYASAALERGDLDPVRVYYRGAASFLPTGDPLLLVELAEILATHGQDAEARTLLEPLATSELPHVRVAATSRLVPLLADAGDKDAALDVAARAAGHPAEQPTVPLKPSELLAELADDEPDPQATAPMTAIDVETELAEHAPTPLETQPVQAAAVTRDGSQVAAEHPVPGENATTPLDAQADANDDVPQATTAPGITSLDTQASASGVDPDGTTEPGGSDATPLDTQASASGDVPHCATDPAENALPEAQAPLTGASDDGPQSAIELPDASAGAIVDVQAENDDPQGGTETVQDGGLEEVFRDGFQREAEGDLAGAVAAFGRVALEGGPEMGDAVAMAANNAVALAVRAVESGEHAVAMAGFGVGARTGLFSDVVFLVWEAALRRTAVGDVATAHAYYATVLGLPGGADEELLRDLREARDVLPEPREELAGLYTALGADGVEAVRAVLEEVPAEHAEEAARTLIAVSRARMDAGAEEARALLRLVTASGPPGPAATAWNDLGDAAGDRDEAIEAYERGAAVEHPASATALRNLAWARLEAGDLEEAAQAAERALVCGDPMAVVVGHRVLGHLRFREDDPDGALHLFRRGLEVAEEVGPDGECDAGDVSRLRLDLARALQQTGDSDAARTEAGRVSAEAADVEIIAKADTYLGNIMVLDGDLADALEAFGRVALLDVGEDAGQLAEIVSTAVNNVLAIAVEAGRAGELAVTVRGIALGAEAGAADGPEDVARIVAAEVSAADPNAFLGGLIGIDPEQDAAILAAMDGPPVDDLDRELAEMLEAEAPVGELDSFRWLLRNQAGTPTAGAAGRQVIRAARQLIATDPARAMAMLALVVEYGDPEEVALAHDDMGDLHAFAEDDMDAAIAAYRKGADVDDPAALQPLRSLIMAQLGIEDHDGVAQTAQRAVTSSDPETVAVGYWAWGDSRAERADTDGAMRLYRQGIDAGHEEVTPHVRVSLARVLRDRGQFEEARAEIERAAAAPDPEVRARAGTMLGSWGWDDDDLDVAATGFGVVCAVEPDGDPGTLRDLVEAAAGNLLVIAKRAAADGDHAVARRALTSAARAGWFKDALEVAGDRAAALAESGDRATAVEYLECAAGFVSDLGPDMEIRLADLQVSAGRIEEARETFERLAGHADADVRLVAGGRLAALARLEGDTEALGGVVERMMDDDSAGGLLGSMLGLMQSEHGDREGGLRTLRAAAEKGEPVAVYTLAHALVDAGEHGEARGVLERLVRDDGGYARDALVQLGRTYLGEDEPRARELFLQVVDAPGEPGERATELALMYLGGIAKGNRDWSEALRWYQRVIDSGSEAQAPMAAAHLGELAYWLNDRDSAVRFYELTLATGTDSPELVGEASCRLGEIRRAEGRLEQAREHLLRAVESGHDGFAAQARELLDGLG
ncbi:tetratricopeptide repeat protein [Spirillospora sp. CA-294931]|uniref:tetratricopeptide repeat protein n=1 Tax=Spirillospora sp. CA-294931 TaxID=3240042 RepID=UPI003D8CA933